MLLGNTEILTSPHLLLTANLVQNVHLALVKISLVLPQCFNFMLCHHNNFGAVTSYPAYPWCCMMLWFSLCIKFSRKWSVCNYDCNSYLHLHISDWNCNKAQECSGQESCLERSALFTLCSWTEYCKKLFRTQRSHRLHNTAWLPVPLTSQQGHTLHPEPRISQQINNLPHIQLLMEM